uniref:Uncharacterized protein n=1 Tax=Candidatus Nitrotoga fabula TaxID=2182327 RepID=A0A2X0QX41_9PROT|nr:protein of unknown function [Candidatus Nitrotoga fabula]
MVLGEPDQCQQIGIEILFPDVENPFLWMSKLIDLKKEKYFFETGMTDYQTGGALACDHLRSVANLCLYIGYIKIEMNVITLFKVINLVMP